MFVTFITIAISSLVKFDHYRDTRASILDPCIQEIFSLKCMLNKCPINHKMLLCIPTCYLFVFPSIRTTFHLQWIFLLCFTTACFHGENTQYSIATIEHILRIDIFGISFLFPLQAPFHFFLNMGSKVFISVKRVVHSMKLSTTVLLQLPKQHLPSFFRKYPIRKYSSSLFENQLSCN